MVEYYRYNITKFDIYCAEIFVKNFMPIMDPKVFKPKLKQKSFGRKPNNNILFSSFIHSFFHHHNKPDWF